MKSNFFPDLLSIPDDGLALTAAEPWVKRKIQLITQHLHAFTDSIASSVDEVVFVDLFAGNGLYCLGDRKEVFAGSSINALMAELPIHKYVLCEEDPEQFRILKIRGNKYFRDKNIILLNGRAEDLVDKLKMYVPLSKKGYKVAVICVADGFALGPGLESIHQLGLQGFNFIVPVTFHLGNKLDYKFYFSQGKEKLKNFLGFISDAEKNWRPENNEIFYRQLIQLWKSRLQGIGLNVSIATQRLDSGLMEIPTYQMCLVSSRYSARSIQLDALAGGQTQFTLFNQN